MILQEAGSQWDIRPWWDFIVACLWGTLVLGIIYFAVIIYRRVRRKVNEIGKGSEA